MFVFVGHGVTLPAMTTVGWLAGIGLIVGVALTWLGLRGRQVDDHPICRKCGRDLFGLNLYGEHEPAVCPECGGKLDLKSIRRGNRQRRPRLLASGLTLATPALLILAGGVALAVGEVDVQRHKPLALLRWEATPEAVAELTRRLADDELSTDTAIAIAGAFLDDQGDAEQTWIPEKGDFIELVQMQGLLPADEWQRYFEQGLRPGVWIPMEWQRGKALPVGLRWEELRLGTPAAPVTGFVTPVRRELPAHLMLTQGERVVGVEQGWSVMRARLFRMLTLDAELGNADVRIDPWASPQPGRWVSSRFLAERERLSDWPTKPGSFATVELVSHSVELDD